MKKSKLKTFLIYLLTGLVVLSFPSPALAQIGISSCWSDCTETVDGNEVVTFRCVKCLVAALIGIAIRVAGVALFVMLIIGGFHYLTARDDPKAIEKAQKTLTFAVIGLVVVISAWFILQAIEIITGLQITTFQLVF